MGQDPYTGEATYPVFTPYGGLAGVARRQTDTQLEEAKAEGRNPSRYKYPFNWTASQVVHRYGSPPVDRGVLVLVEGAADAFALWEVGIPAWALYGSAMHMGQAPLVAAAQALHVLCGHDNDKAGDTGAYLTSGRLRTAGITTERITWSGNDPASITPRQRLEAVVELVGEHFLPTWTAAVEAMDGEMAA
jgi:hypothetical protein